MRKESLIQNYIPDNKLYVDKSCFFVKLEADLEEEWFEDSDD